MTPVHVCVCKNRHFSHSVGRLIKAAVFLLLWELWEILTEFSCGWKTKNNCYLEIKSRWTIRPWHSFAANRPSHGLSVISRSVFVQRFPPAGAVGLCNPDRLFHYRKVIVVPTKPHNSSWQPSQAFSGFSFRKTTAEVVLRDAAHHCGLKEERFGRAGPAEKPSALRGFIGIMIRKDRWDGRPGRSVTHRRTSLILERLPVREVWTQCWVHEANNYYHILKEEEGEEDKKQSWNRIPMYWNSSNHQVIVNHEVNKSDKNCKTHRA